MKTKKCWRAVENLVELQFLLSPTLCQEIWGHELGNHMWQKFIRLDRNLLALIQTMDLVTMDRVINYLDT